MTVRSRNPLEDELQNALATLLSLSDEEKQVRGIAHTPREIYQQPETWLKTGRMMASARLLLLEALEAVGIESPNPKDRPVVILAGAGTSDYIGHAVSRIFRQHWNCEVMV